MKITNVFRAFGLLPQIYCLLRNRIAIFFIRTVIIAAWSRRGVYIHNTVLLSYSNKEKISIGKNTSFGAFTTVLVANDPRNPKMIGHLVIGKSVYVGEQVNIRAAGGKITIGDNTLVANGATLVAANHDIQSGTPIADQPWSDKKTNVIIGRDVWIGAHAVLLPGCRIHDGAIIAAGAVVSGNVESNEIFGGVPARKIGVRPSSILNPID